MGPQSKEVMSLEKPALKQSKMVERKVTQVPGCSDRQRKGQNKSECICMQNCFWGN